MSRSSRHNLCYSYARCLFRYLDFNWWHIINVSGVTTMSSHVWCHGPECHTKVTQDRVRGSKGSKVLRTRKLKIYNPNYIHMYSYFCSNSCYNEFANKYIEQIIRIAPRLEPLETRINDPKRTEHEGWGGHKYYHTEITKVDNESNVG